MQRLRQWEFKTARFKVKLVIEYELGYRYDGDDPDGEVQAKLDSGEYVAFTSDVLVYLNGVEIGLDTLCGSVYECGKESEFWTAHRDPDPMHRNCSIMRAAKGENVAIGHYFPDMVRTAVADARRWLANVPEMRSICPACGKQPSETNLCGNCYDAARWETAS